MRSIGPPPGTNTGSDRRLRSDRPAVRQVGIFDGWLARWRLTPDGEPIATHSSDLVPVRCEDGERAMLKVAREAEERFGGVLMVWWAGDGAARVLAQEGDALLLERALGRGSLTEMALSGRDDEASRILCRVAARLHAPRDGPLPDLVPLSQWFEALEPAANAHGGILRACANAARTLLREPSDLVVLHGDLHHGNVLDFGPRGWLAIDPKRRWGERGFDFANLFCNPDLGFATAPGLCHPDLAVATAPGRLARRAHVVAEAAGLDRARLLRWVLAYAGLSAAWFLEDGQSPEVDLTVAALAAAELANG